MERRWWCMVTRNKEINKAEMVLFTDFRRDGGLGRTGSRTKGALTIAPAAKKLISPREILFGQNLDVSDFHDNSNNDKTGIIPIRVHRFVRGRGHREMRDIDLGIINKRGYTRGSVTYIADYR